MRLPRPTPTSALTIVALIAACSRQPVEQVEEVDLPPLPSPARVYVDYEGGMSTGVSRAITDGAVLAQLGSLVDADHGAWVDIYKKWGKAPMRQLRVEWSSEAPPFGETVDIGSNWIMRSGLLQTIPEERALAILNLLRSPDTPTIDGASRAPGP